MNETIKQQKSFPFHFLYGNKNKPEPTQKTEPTPQKKEKKYSLQDLIFVALIIFGLTFICLSIIYNEQANVKTTEFNEKYTALNEANIQTLAFNQELYRQRNEYRLDGSLFMNHLILAHNLKNAETVDEYMAQQGIFMTRYYELIYSYGDQNINEKLKNLNFCYVTLQKIREEAGNINEQERVCGLLNDDITLLLHDKLKNRYTEIFIEEIKEGEK